MAMQRNPSLAAVAKRQQGFCTRCLQTSHLRGHHVWALADGGPDTTENIDVLCETCHDEWHDHGEHVGITYPQFLQTMPVRDMLVMQVWAPETVSAWADSLTRLANKMGVKRPAIPEAWHTVPDRDDRVRFQSEIRAVRLA